MTPQEKHIFEMMLEALTFIAADLEIAKNFPSPVDFTQAKLYIDQAIEAATK